MPRWPAILVSILVSVAAAILLVISMQTQLLFPTDAVPPAGPLAPNGEQLQVKANGGETLRGVHLQPAAETGPRTLIIGFGGNAWNAQDAAEYLHELFPDAHVIAFHYRGYRPSTGSPSAEALLDDAPLILAHAVKRVRPERTVAIGFSIGSGLAASLAGKVDGMILVTPFDSLKAVAGDLYPWLPVGPFFEHEIEAAGFLVNSAVPVAILAAELDELFRRLAPTRCAIECRTWCSTAPSLRPATMKFTNALNSGRLCRRRWLPLRGANVHILFL